MRLRVTAFPLRLETTNPTRGGPGCPEDLTTTSPPWRLRLPSDKTLRKSFSPRRVCTSGGETLTAFLTTSLERGAPGSCPHPIAKTVSSLAPAHLGLISPFHDEFPGERGSRRQVTNACIPSQSTTVPVTAVSIAGSRRKLVDRENKMRAIWSRTCRGTPSQYLGKAYLTCPFTVDSSQPSHPQG